MICKEGKLATNYELVSPGDGFTVVVRNSKWTPICAQSLHLSSLIIEAWKAQQTKEVCAINTIWDRMKRLPGFQIELECWKIIKTSHGKSPRVIL